MAENQHRVLVQVQKKEGQEKGKKKAGFRDLRIAALNLKEEEERGYNCTTVSFSSNTVETSNVDTTPQYCPN
jgi:hypothetical protein